jgi:hypothetical protein
MKRIPLTKGYVTVLDDEDYEILRHRKWSTLTSNKTKKVYACSADSVRGGGRFKLSLMHRVILGLSPGQFADHIDGDGLNNQRSNLRVATRDQNRRNTGLMKSNRSGFKGVYFKPRIGKWIASIKDGRTKHLGCFSTPEEAAKAYDAAALKLHGEFACTNASIGLL